MARGVEPTSVGRTIVATWQPHEAAVLSSISELGLDYQIIFNKGAVMGGNPPCELGSSKVEFSQA